MDLSILRNPDAVRKLDKGTKGILGEEFFRQLCELKGTKPIDLRQLPEYWTKDVDFIINNKHIEVKTDTWCTIERPSIYYELTGNKGEEGSTARSQADYIYYIAPCYGEKPDFFVFNNAKLKEVANSKTYPTKKSNEGSTGAIIPLADLYSSGVIVNKDPHQRQQTINKVIEYSQKMNKHSEE